jgi:uncharacterized protein YhbP (UPF0306 family)
MNASLHNASYPCEVLHESVFSILNAVELCSIATSNRDSSCHINTAYYCFTKALELYFVSDPNTIHCTNLAHNPNIAIAICDSHQHWGEPLRGLQLFGSCHVATIAESAKALFTHAARFHAFGDYMSALSPIERENSSYRFYVFVTSSVKIFDEPRFGEETFVTATVMRQ